MAIIGTLPSSLSNGTTADASQVMSDLNFIANQVNANASPLTNNPSFTTVTTTGGSSSGGVVVQSIDVNGANIKLVGNGTTTPSKTVRAQNGSFQVLNDAYSAAIMTLTDVGNLACTGTITGTNITGSSDERLKEDWRPLRRNFIERLAEVKYGTFKRKGNRKREVGVSAQSLRKVLRESVFVGKGGMLEVAYGNAALVASIELSKEVVELRARIKALESMK